MTARTPKGVGVLVVVLFLGTSCANVGTGHEARAGEDTGYEFDAITLQEVDQQTIRISWITRWRGSLFPGVRLCHWNALDDKGISVGSLSDEFLGMSPVGERVAVEVRVEARAASASIACDEDRLDDGLPYRYAISDIVPASLGDERPWGISFSAVWEGTGQPGPVSCDAALLAEDGTAISTDVVNIYVATGTVKDGLVVMPPPKEEAMPDSALISGCRPFA